MVEFEDNKAVFYGKLNTRVHRHFQMFVNRVKRTRKTRVTLDFSRCTNAYPNTMVPIVAEVQALIAARVTMDILLPRDQNLNRLFLRSNWAHFLDPIRYDPSDDVHYRHLTTQRFCTFEEQQRVVNDFMDVTMRLVEIDRSLLTGLEWSINEITDNVINHAQSSVGGFVQLAAYQDNQRIAYCVADAGRGILDSLREGYPNLRRDCDAIADAVRAGVTRNQDAGQGNGLSGSLKITMGAQGQFAVGSGRGYMEWSAHDNNPFVKEFPLSQLSAGTFVDVQFPLGRGIDLSSIFDGPSRQSNRYRVSDTIELNYLDDDGTSLSVKMVEETAGFGSRQSGQQMRTKVKNLMAAEPTCPLYLDWDGVQLISSSYADEFLGKLFFELGPLSFMNMIRHRNMTLVIKQLIDLAIMQRTQQEMGRPSSS